LKSYIGFCTFLFFIISGFAYAKDEIEIAKGVTVSGNFASLGGRDLSISLSVSNRTEEHLQILLVKREPVAIDNRGTDYYFDGLSGMPYCKYKASGCLLGRGYYGAQNHIVPLEEFSIISPGATVVVNYKFRSQGNAPSNPTIFSISSVALVRKIVDLLADDLLSEEEKRDQFQTISVGIPSLPNSN